jgi:hypothetical protein
VSFNGTDNFISDTVYRSHAIFHLKNISQAQHVFKSTDYISTHTHKQWWRQQYQQVPLKDNGATRDIAL